MDFKRKIYQQLLEWKKDKNRLPLIVNGLRQVGKSYIVDKFAKENYENVIVYDFRHQKNLRLIFENSLDVDSIILNSSPYFAGSSFIPHKTVLIFEEIGDCPLARTSLKSFALDKRFDVIATGSLLGVINYRRKAKIDIPDGYEKIIEMTSMDFEEFLWANGVSESSINILKEHTKTLKELPVALDNYYKELLKRYIVVGGMPRSVVEYLSTNNYMKSRELLINLIKEYRGDFGRFINDKEEEKSTNCKAAAARNVMEGKTNYKAKACYKIIRNNFGTRSFFHSIPQYATSFLLDDVKTKLKEGVFLPPLDYPKIE